MESLQKSAAAAQGVTSNVQGFQQMLASGTRVQAQLVTLNASVTKTNLLLGQQAAQNEEGKRQKDSARADTRAAMEASDKEAWDAVNKRKISFPSPMKYAPNGGE
jgi:hypothetical protein